MSGFDTLFGPEKFPVDLKHLIEGIRDVYSFEVWKIPIVENVDNFIDNREYHTIHFVTEKSKLKITMLGSGIDERTFRDLATIAFTTKIDDVMRKKKEGLGYFGWGMKAAMIVAEKVIIETKKGNYIGRQEWFFINGEPHRQYQEPTLIDKSWEDQTIIIYHLKKEYENKLTNEKNIIEVLQEFYPTLLSGAPALGKRRTFLVNNNKVPKPNWLDENNYIKIETFKNIKVSGYPVGGRVYISEKELPEEQRGIRIIVCGRNIIDSKLDNFPEIRNYTGYVHADVLYRDLVGDKTRIKMRDNPRFRQLKTMVNSQLRVIFEREGLIQKTGIRDKEFMRKVHRVIANVLEQIPELESFGIAGPLMGKVTSYFKGDEIPVETELGASSKTDIPTSLKEEGVDQWGTSIPKSIIKKSDKSDRKGRKVRRKRRALPQFQISKGLPVDVEASFDGGEKVIINMDHPLYQSAERSQISRLYHVCRAGLEAILDYLLSKKEISIDEYLKLKRIITSSLGDAL